MPKLPGLGGWSEDPLWGSLYDWTVEHQPLHVGAGGGDDVVLDPGEDRARVHPAVDAALEPARDGGQGVLLAPPEHGELVVRVQQA